MEFLPTDLQNYVDAHIEPEPPILQELARQTALKVMYPRMISGHLQGRFLSLISRIMRPKYILEIGTYTGYSAICLAEGIQPDGKLVTLEIDPEFADFAAGYFKKSESVHLIEQKLGSALHLIPTLDYTFDLVFMDAHKDEYIDYYEAVLPKLRPGGVIITDNVLWSGQVIDPKFTDATTESLRQFNTKILNDSRVFKVLLPIRDGLYVIIKN